MYSHNISIFNAIIRGNVLICVSKLEHEANHLARGRQNTNGTH